MQKQNRRRGDSSTRADRSSTANRNRYTTQDAISCRRKTSDIIPAPIQTGNKNIRKYLVLTY